MTSRHAVAVPSIVWLFENRSASHKTGPIVARVWNARVYDTATRFNGRLLQSSHFTSSISLGRQVLSYHGWSGP